MDKNTEQCLIYAAFKGCSEKCEAIRIRMQKNVNWEPPVNSQQCSRHRLSLEESQHFQIHIIALISPRLCEIVLVITSSHLLQ